MKTIVIRLSLAAAFTFSMIALAQSAHAQEPGSQAPSAQQQNEQQMPAAGPDTTQDAQAFTGRIVKENGKVVLKDPVTKNSYQINVDDVSKAKPFMGKQVKVTGKLDMNSNTIRIETIEVLS